MYGVDLFNHRYWWEAHEAWEAIWLAAGRNSQAGCFIQGLIQLAAGQLKRIMEEPSGASLLTDSAAEKLAVGGSLFLGIAVEPLIESALASLSQSLELAPVIQLRWPETR